jgi:hypothetical protein
MPEQDSPYGPPAHELHIGGGVHPAAAPPPRGRRRLMVAVMCERERLRDAVWWLVSGAPLAVVIM